MVNESSIRELTVLTEQPAAFLSYRWNRIVDTLAKLFNAQSCIITEQTEQGLLVRACANTPDTPFKAGDIIPASHTVFCSRAINEKRQLHVVDKVKNASDTYTTLSYCGSPLINLDGSVFGTLCILEAKCTISENRTKIIVHDFSRMIEHDLDWSKHLDELSEHAYLDPLTKLHNRRGFFHLARQQIKWIIRHRKHVGLLFIDIDGLKEINDLFGHAKGDSAICTLASIIQANLRPSDLCARYGGDEFIIFTVASEACELDVITERLQSKINQIQIGSDLELYASIGTVLVEASADFNLEQLIKIADKNMYEQKHARKNMLNTSGITTK